MNMIFEWAGLVKENKMGLEREELFNLDEIEGGRIGISRPDELGKNINGIISKDIFDNRNDSTKDLYNANFKCNVSDTGTLTRLFPSIPKGILPLNASFLYFICKHGQLDPERMIEYINSTCGEVLQEPMKKDDVLYLGQYDMKYGNEGMQDIFVMKNGDFGNYDEDDPMRIEVNNALNEIKDGYKEQALMVKYGSKEYLKKYLKSNIQAWNKLEEGEKYVLMMALKGTLSPQKRLKVANSIDAYSEVLGGRDVESEEIMSLGTIRGKYKATGSVFELDAFAIKV